MTLTLKLRHTSDETVEILTLCLCSPPTEPVMCDACGDMIIGTDFGRALVRIDGENRPMRLCRGCLSDITDVPGGATETSKEPVIPAGKAQTMKRLQAQMIENAARQVDDVSVKPSCYRVVEISRILSETAERIRKLARDEVDT